MSEQATPKLGKLVPPYPVEVCALADCESRFESGAYLYRDLDSGKLVVFCEDCSLHVEIVAPWRFMLVAL